MRPQATSARDYEVCVCVCVCVCDIRYAMLKPELVLEAVEASLQVCYFAKGRARLIVQLHHLFHMHEALSY